MKLSFHKDDAIQSIQPIQGIISSKNILPILSHIILEADEKTARVIGSDLEMWVSSPFPAQIESGGSVSIPGRRFLSIIRELPDTDMVLEADSDNLTTITCARSYFKMKGVSRDEFPAPPQLGDAQVLSISQPVLKDLITKTAYAISIDETRYVLNGLYLVFENGEITAVATDGRRLALAKTDCNIPDGFSANLILPLKAVQELARILSGEGDGEITVGDRQISFKFPGVVMISRLIDGRFPNYQQVIPKEEGNRISLPRIDFLQMVKRASLITDDKSNSVKFQFAPGQLTITAVTPDVGEAREEMNIGYDGPAMEIAFNPEYIMDVLKALDEEDEVILEMRDSNSPGVIRTEGSFLCVVMPMKLT